MGNDRPTGTATPGSGAAPSEPPSRTVETVPDAIMEPPASPASLPAAPDRLHPLTAMRRARRRSFFLRLGGFVGVPTALTFLYMIFWATPCYVSEFQLTYQTYQESNSLAGGLIQNLSGTSQLNNTVDLGVIIYEYVRSSALLNKLDGELNLRKYFSNRTIDSLSRLSPTASHDEFLKFYRSQVSVSEGLGGYVTISVRAFDPHYAQVLATAIVKACDTMLDDMTARARKDEMTFAEAEATRQEERVQRSLQAITDFQNALGDQDPQRVATQLGQIVGSLESDLALTRTQLAGAEPYLHPDSPLIIQMKSRISSLEQQLQHEQGRLANTKGKLPYSQILAQYTALQLEQEFAKNAYLAAQQALAAARADVARKQNYIVDFSPPSEPDKPDPSLPLVSTVTVFLAALIAFSFGSLVIGAFRDQMGL
jgi:capsular polysaccharide transport system permease protein